MNIDEIYQLLKFDDTINEVLQVPPPSNGPAIDSVGFSVMGSNEENQPAPDTPQPDTEAGKDARFSIGRLDFRVAPAEHVSESNFKMMTSKEKRQLRNKISARNFRHRRKEYISSLEEKVEALVAENKKLKVEVEWMNNNMEKLQKENDQLRLDIALLRQGLPTTDLSLPVTTTSQVHTLPLTNPTPLSSTPLPYTSSSSSSPSSPDFTSPNSTSSPEIWDFFFPNVTLIDRADLPSWDLSRALVVKNQQTPTTLLDPKEVFERYPLLAPALMSMVLGQTLTLSSQAFMANSAFSPVIPRLPSEQYMLPKSFSQLSTKAAASFIELLQWSISRKLLSEGETTETNLLDNQENTKTSAPAPATTNDSNQTTSYVCPTKRLRRSVMNLIFGQDCQWFACNNSRIQEVE